MLPNDPPSVAEFPTELSCSFVALCSDGNGLGSVDAR